MTLEHVAANEWHAVDHTPSPGTFVDYLDAISSQSGVRAYKQASMTLLGLKSGERVLDVGCGTGEDAQAMAWHVGPAGRVIGVDASQAMVEESRRRASDLGLPVDFQAGDAHCLEFDDGAFGATRADRVLQHLEYPERAVAELIRVTRPGGRIVIADTDWGTLLVDAPDRETTEVVLAEVASVTRNSWMGRQLYGLVQRAGLRDVTVSAFAGAITEKPVADRLLYLAGGLERAWGSRKISRKAADRWEQALQDAAAAGCFFSSITVFIVAGTRP
jgi:ubiquinone/menaquinone biosynthesis C-methylase UbiE